MLQTIRKGGYHLKRYTIAVVGWVVVLAALICVMLSYDTASPVPAATADSAQQSRSAYTSLPAGGTLVLALADASEDDMLTAWKSSDEAIVTVDSGGRLDAAKEGAADVTAYFSDGHTYTCHVTVKEAEPEQKADKFTTAIIANETIAEQNAKNQKKSKKLPYRLHVNRKMNCVTAYTYGADGKYTVPVRTMLCSCGLENTTVTGIYDIGFHTIWHPLVNDVIGQYASSIVDDIMFHSVPYTDFAKNSLKVDEFNKLGEAASRGCIRLAVGDAKWINDNCAEGTVVFIYENDIPGPLGRPEAIRITDKKCLWDPTDQDKGNPYNKSYPVITGAEDKTITAGSGFDAAAKVRVADSCGNDITYRLEIIGHVNPDRAGTYKLTYQATDALHRSTKKDVTITVVRPREETP